MGLLGKIKRLRILKSVGKGLLDVAGLGTIKANREDNHLKDENGNPTGKGRIDWVRLGTFLTVVAIAISIVIIVLGVILGKIELQTAIDLIKALK